MTSQVIFYPPAALVTLLRKHDLTTHLSRRWRSGPGLPLKDYLLTHLFCRPTSRAMYGTFKLYCLSVQNGSTVHWYLCTVHLVCTLYNVWVKARYSGTRYCTARRRTPAGVHVRTYARTRDAVVCAVLVFQGCCVILFPRTSIFYNSVNFQRLFCALAYLVAVHDFVFSCYEWKRDLSVYGVDIPD